MELHFSLFLEARAGPWAEVGRAPAAVGMLWPHLRGEQSRIQR